jgi:hypothetical protein
VERKLGLIFALLIPFYPCGLMALVSGYDFFHTTNPTGNQASLFLIYGGASLFLGFQLLKAFTDPLPAWYTNLSPTPVREKTDEEKRQHFRRHVTAFAIVYVVYMTFFTGIIVGPRLEFSRERIALLTGFGLLAVLLLFFLLDVFRAIYMFRKGGKTSKKTA